MEDKGLLFACIDKLERVARTSMEKGQYSNTIGAIKLLNEMLRLGADQKSMRAPDGVRERLAALTSTAELEIMRKSAEIFH